MEGGRDMDPSSIFYFFLCNLFQCKQVLNDLSILLLKNQKVPCKISEIQIIFHKTFFLAHIVPWSWLILYRRKAESPQGCSFGNMTVFLCPLLQRHFWIYHLSQMGILESHLGVLAFIQATVKPNWAVFQSLWRSIPDFQNWKYLNPFWK